MDGPERIVPLLATRWGRDRRYGRCEKTNH